MTVRLDKITTISKPIFEKPYIDPLVQLKWGLSLLGSEQATSYLKWLKEKHHIQFSHRFV